MNDAVTDAGAAWRRAWPALVALLAAILWAYRDTAIGMETIWARSETFAHAFLVPPIAAWLIWQQRASLAVLAPRPSAWALPLLGLAAAAWLMGDLVATNSLTQLSLVAMLVLAVPLTLGWQVTRRLAFPLAFLFFCVPLGEFLMPALMSSTADFTVFALRLTGIPVYREGQQFVIPSGNWSVVEACSGIRYLIASLMVGVLFAYLNYRSLRRRLIFVGISILVPIIANWMRAYLIVLLGHLSNNRLAVGVDHIVYGWLFFGVIMIALYVVGARWAEPPAVAATPVAVARPAARALAAQLWGGAAAAALLLVAPIAIESAIDGAIPHGPPTLALPQALSAGWRSTEQPLADWTPAFQNPSAHASRTYAHGADKVGLYIGYYRRQGYDRKLVSSENVLVTLHDPAWTPVSWQVRRIPSDDGDLEVQRVEIRGSPHDGLPAGPTLAAWQLYWVNGTLTGSDFAAKAWGAWHKLLGRGDDAAAIVVYAPADAAGGADALLATFLRANLHTIATQLVRTRDGDPPVLEEK